MQKKGVKRREVHLVCIFHPNPASDYDSNPPLEIIQAALMLSLKTPMPAMTILSYLSPGLIQLVVGVLQLPHKTQHKPAHHDLRK
ncbi:hypothetical protein ABXJ76_09295 [Methylobacter sp. G7]|uniref:hypothetical protein n=1 Tax=Methylobacter sp. G7 TaxID=3230117 RepID=UPI003D804B20